MSGKILIDRQFVLFNDDTVWSWSFPVFWLFRALLNFSRVIGSAIAMLVGIVFILLIVSGLNGAFLLLNNSPWIWTCSAGLAVRLQFLYFTLMCLALVLQLRSGLPLCSSMLEFSSLVVKNGLLYVFSVISSSY